MAQVARQPEQRHHRAVGISIKRRCLLPEVRAWMADVYEEGVRVVPAAGVAYELPRGDRVDRAADQRPPPAVLDEDDTHDEDRLEPAR